MKSLSTLLGSVALATLATTAIAQDGDMLVFDYSGFEAVEFHGNYIAQHGASPTFAFFGDEEEAFQKLVSGFKSDVTHICAGSVTKWVESGIIEPWDTSKVTEYANLNSDLTGAKVGDTSDVYFLPTDYGSTAIAYNTDKVPVEDVASLDVFLNPKYAGRITISDNVDDAYALAYLATGVTDWSDISDEQFAAASAWLRAAHPNLRTYWTDAAELSQLLGTGEVLVSWAWNETYPTMVGEGFPVGFQRDTSEGSSLWLCGYVNMKESNGDEAKVYDYLNAILDSSSTQALLDFGYGHSNQPAMESIGEEALTASGLGSTSAPILAQLPLSVELRSKHSAEFEKIKAGF